MGGSHGGQRSTRCPKNDGVLKEGPSAIRYGVAIFQRRADGLNEQIFGVNEQVPERGQTYLSRISLKVIWEKQRTSTFSHHRRVKRLI
jgi:hypothetical protein